MFRADHRATVQPGAPATGGAAGGGKPGSSSSGTPGGGAPSDQLRALTVSGGAQSTMSGAQVAAQGDASLGRGSTRGKRDEQGVILRTRPEGLESKKGQSGSPITLLSNYFRSYCSNQFKTDF